jgi:transcriptional regulator with XRE-family HTH domain
MPKKNSPTDDFRKQVGARIKQARQMAGFKTRAALIQALPEWSVSRLGNYEQGISMPASQDILKIAEVTKINPCWIQFGLGSIGSGERDLQAIRHQNLSQLVKSLNKAEVTALRKTTGLKPSEFKQHLDNPFLKLHDKLCRKVEKQLKKPRNWMDEQHVELDGLCAYFPDDLQEILMIYSNLDQKEKDQMMQISRVIADGSS